MFFNNTFILENAFENTILFNLFTIFVKTNTISISFLYITTNIVMFISIFFFNNIIYNIDLFNIYNIDCNQFILYYFKYIYIFIYNLGIDYIESLINNYFIYIFFLWLNLFLFNLLGLVPTVIALTGHLSTTLQYSIITWLIIVSSGIYKFGNLFISHLIPKGIPNILIFFLMSIEILSYIFRMISLALRLFANIVAGHILIHTVSGFIFLLFYNKNNGFMLINILHSFILFCVLILLFIIELIVAFLQSYIFIVLTLIYLQDLIILSEEH